MNHNRIPCVLTIAGSDSGGGAGIQADLRTFYAFRVYGSSVISAVTAQNPDKVSKVDVLSVESVKAQLESVLGSFPVRFAKTGMLANSGIIDCVAESIQEYDLSLIVDPVMVSTSGAKLLEDSAIKVMQEKLFPLAEWITPNIPEAELLSGRVLSGEKALLEAAEFLCKKYKCNVLLKSGHAISSGVVTDIVCCEGELFTLSSPVAEVDGNTAHGTGCTLSAALTASLASGRSWQEALTEAKSFVYGSLCENRKIRERLFQMYPPQNDHSERVILKPY